MKINSKKAQMASVISGVLSIISLIVTFIAVANKPSASVYQVAAAFGNTLSYDIINFLCTLMPILFIVFAVAAVALFVYGLTLKKKGQ